MSKKDDELFRLFMNAAGKPSAPTAAEIKEIAALLRKLFLSLVEEGFSEKQAMVITLGVIRGGQ